MLVVGAGAIGSFLAARLANAGSDTIVFARGQRLHDLKREGIRLEEGGTTLQVRVRAAGAGEPMQPPDLAILCTKTVDLPDAIGTLQAWHDRPLTVLTTQNGVDAPELVSRTLPAATVLASRIHGFFEFDGKAVRHVGVRPSLVLGGWSPGSEAAERQVAGILDLAGVPAEASADIRIELWTKLVLAGPVGGVGALLGVPAGCLRVHPDHWRLLTEAVAETAAVARAEGVALSADVEAATLEFVRTFPAEATTSLQRDLAAGRPSEFDALVGSVLRRGSALGLDLAVHRALAGRFAPAG